MMPQTSAPTTRPAGDKIDKIRRVKTGCLTCRSRRKKCDEKKPLCTGCIRNDLPCTWPTLIEPVVPTKMLRQRWSRKEGLLPSIKPRKFSQNDRKVMISNYDNTARVPITFQLICTVDVWPDSISLRLPNISGVFSQPFSRVLLQHYLHRTVDCLSCLDRSVTPFITDIMPIALSNNLVMQAVLALSGLHYTDTVSNALEDTTWTHYTQAVETLKVELGKYTAGESSDPLPLLVTTLLLCIGESFRGDVHGNMIVHHLTATRHLLGVCIQKGSISPDTLGFIAEVYSYTAVVSNISMDIYWDEWLNSDNPTLFQPEILSHRGSGMLYGCAQQLFQLIPQIAMLAKERRMDEDELGTYSDESLSMYRLLRGKIKQWQASVRVADATVNVCGRIYQKALLTHLETSFYKYDQSSHLPEYVNDALDSFVSLLDEFPPESPISTTICWPLVVFGCCATQDRHQRVIKAMLESTYDNLGMASIRQCRDLVGTIWDSGKTYTDAWSLESVMTERNMHVAFA